MTTEDRDVVLGDEVYAYLRTPDRCSSDWVRVAMLQHRMAGDDGPVHGAAKIVVAWNREARQVERGTIEFSAARNYQISKYFRDRFDVPNWTQVVVTCDIDGTQRATVTIDPAGPPESDYLAVFDNPFYKHLDEHRAELEELARRYYGSGR